MQYLSVILLLLALGGNYTSFALGQKFYGQKQPPLCDVLQNFFPSWEKYHDVINLFLPLFLFPILLLPAGQRWPLALSFLSLFLLFMGIRAVSSTVTVLPHSYQTCPATKLTPATFLLGHCYDKISSGHFAFCFLLYLFYIQSNRFSTLFISGLGTALSLNAFLLVVTRAHYTVDVVLSGVISYLLFHSSLPLSALLSG